MRLPVETVEKVLNALKEAGIPINNIAFQGSIDGCHAFACGFQASPSLSFLAAMFGGMNPGETVGWEGLLKIWDAENATLHAVNGCDHGCQFFGEYNGLKWSVRPAEMTIKAN